MINCRLIQCSGGLGLSLLFFTVTTFGVFQADGAKRQEVPEKERGKTELSRQIPPDAGSPDAPLLFCIGLHIEPFGAQVSRLAENPAEQREMRDERKSAEGKRRQKAERDYNNQVLFKRHVENIRQLADLVERHNGKLTVQAQTPFTRVCAENCQSVLSDLQKAGHEIALHFHEDAHLGKGCEKLGSATWAAVMLEEKEWIAKACPGARVRYWSGGNNYPKLLAAASDAGLDVMGDHKNPRRQKTFEELLAVNPWRPSGGPTEDDIEAFAKHDPYGKIIYLPDGVFAGSDFAERKRNGDGAWFDAMTEGLELSLKAARKDRVNVFHITLHPGECHGPPRTSRPFAIVDQWLTQVVDPLVKSGKIRWTTFSRMADAYKNREESHPGADPRSGDNAVATNGVAALRGYMNFAVNVHDWVNPDESADTLMKLIGIFGKYKVRGDFYFTAPVIEKYLEKRPDVIKALIDSKMGINYHLRPPHPAYAGFDLRLKELDGRALREKLLDYENYRLDLATGGIQMNRPGGYALVSKTFGRPPVCVSPQTSDRRIKGILDGIYRNMGAKMVIQYHETGTALDKPFEYLDGLLIRPSDFSITRWTAADERNEVFWWNKLAGKRADPAAFDPTEKLKKELAAWDGPRPPFITALIHENNFYHFGPEAWKSYYFADPRAKTPLEPPYRLDAPDRGRMRPAEERARILQAYENMVAYAAANLRVVVAEDIVALAESGRDIERH